MRNKFTLIALLSSLIFLTGCSKDILRPYEDRLEGGTWRLDRVSEVGFPRSSITILRGDYTFYSDGSMIYQDRYGGFFEGDWQIRKFLSDECYIDDWGNSVCNSEYWRELTIYAVDYDTRERIRIIFDDIRFTGTNTFKGYIYDVGGTYIFTFRR